MSALKRYVMIGVVVVIGVTLAAGVANAQDPSETCFQRGGWWDAEQGQCTIRAGLEMELVFPLDYEAYPGVYRTIDQFVYTTRAEFLGNALLNGAFSQPGAGPWSLTVGFEEYQFSPTVVSVVFSIYEYTGGASGFGATRSFVFDLAADRQLAMSDIFQPGTLYLETLAPLVRQNISAQVGIPVDDQWLVDGTAPSAANYENFAITPAEFLVFFDEYQVAPGAAGPVTARVPLTELGWILAPAFQP